MVVTSHDVARLAGVSQPTVSRALRDSPKVSELTRRRVRDAATALGYVLSDTGRALSVDEAAAAARAAMTLGVPVPAGLSTDQELTVDHDGATVRVRWWPGTGDSIVTDGSPEGIGRAVAHLAGRWADRALAVAAAAGDPLTLAEDGVA